MVARNQRRTSILASASVIRWVGRRLWRSFFLVMFALVLGLLVWTLTSAAVFTRVSAVLGDLWPEAPLVADGVARDLAAAQEERGALEAEVAALAARLAEVEEALAASEAERVAAEAEAERRLARLVDTTRRWLDLQRDVTRLEGEAAAAAEAEAEVAPPVEAP